jgi:hypothetical protein
MPYVISSTNGACYRVDYATPASTDVPVVMPQASMNPHQRRRCPLQISLTDGELTGAFTVPNSVSSQSEVKL